MIIMYSINAILLALAIALVGAPLSSSPRGYPGDKYSPDSSALVDNNNTPVNHNSGDTAENSDRVWVEPDFRSDGTCVRGHLRSSPRRECSLVGTEHEALPMSIRATLNPDNGGAVTGFRKIERL